RLQRDSAAAALCLVWLGQQCLSPRGGISELQHPARRLVGYPPRRGGQDPRRPPAPPNPPRRPRPHPPPPPAPPQRQEEEVKGEAQEVQGERERAARLTPALDEKQSSCFAWKAQLSREVPPGRCPRLGRCGHGS